MHVDPFEPVRETFEERSAEAGVCRPPRLTFIWPQGGQRGAEIRKRILTKLDSQLEWAAQARGAIGDGLTASSASSPGQFWRDYLQHPQSLPSLTPKASLLWSKWVEGPSVKTRGLRGTRRFLSVFIKDDTEPGGRGRQRIKSFKVGDIASSTVHPGVLLVFLVFLTLDFQVSTYEMWKNVQRMLRSDVSLQGVKDGAGGEKQLMKDETTHPNSSRDKKAPSRWNSQTTSGDAKKTV